MSSAIAQPTQCGHCGMLHGPICPRIKAIEYHENGIVKRVEYVTEVRDMQAPSVGPNTSFSNATPPAPPRAPVVKSGIPVWGFPVPPPPRPEPVQKGGMPKPFWMT